MPAAYRLHVLGMHQTLPGHASELFAGVAGQGREGIGDPPVDEPAVRLDAEAEAQIGAQLRDQAVAPLAGAEPHLGAASRLHLDLEAAVGGGELLRALGDPSLELAPPLLFLGEAALCRSTDLSRDQRRRTGGPAPEQERGQGVAAPRREAARDVERRHDQEERRERALGQAGVFPTDEREHHDGCRHLGGRREQQARSDGQRRVAALREADPDHRDGERRRKQPAGDAALHVRKPPRQEQSREQRPTELGQPRAPRRCDVDPQAGQQQTRPPAEPERHGAAWGARAHAPGKRTRRNDQHAER